MKPRDVITYAALALMAGYIGYDAWRDKHAPDPANPPAVNAVALGKSYGPALASAYADGWDAAAETLEGGKTVAEAQQSLQGVWRESLVSSFRQRVEPAFNVVLPVGTEPNDATKRKQVAQLWRDFAAGLRKP